MLQRLPSAEFDFQRPSGTQLGAQVADGLSGSSLCQSKFGGQKLFPTSSAPTSFIAIRTTLIGRVFFAAESGQ
jgi:hypothetical protein